MKKALIFFGIALLLTISSFFSGRSYERRRNIKTTDVKMDTVTRWKIATVEKPQPKTWSLKDYILLPVTDTIHRRDSVFIPLPITSKVYEGENYKLAISGYRTSLDFVSIKYPESVVTQFVQEKHHFIYIDATASVWKSATIIPSAGYEFRSGRFAANCGVGYNLMEKNPVIIAGVKFDVFNW